MASDRRIRITPAFQRDFVVNVTDCFRLTLTADNGHLVPNEIFACRAVPIQPGDAEVRGVFSHICSPVDLEEFPVGQPYVNAVPPWFRLAAIALKFRGRDEAMVAYDQILGDITALVASMDAADVLEAAAPVWIGSDGGAGSSSAG